MSSWIDRPDGFVADEAQGVLERSSRSFSTAAAFLPRPIRSQVCALYAWCRSVDDAVDHAASQAEANKTLRVLDADLTRCEGGDSVEHPASLWIRSLVAEEKIDPRHARELIEGMRLDLDGFVVKNRGDLERYCYHAAGTVGLMMSSLMGVKDRAAGRHAVALGVAMQLTNIARDVREDAERGRSYLPGIPSVFDADPEAVRASVRQILDLAESQYDVALEGLCYLPWRCRTAIRVALEAYREIGREVLRRGCDVLSGRTVISKRRLAWVALRALGRSATSDIFASVRQPFYRYLSPFKDFSMTDESQAQNQLHPCSVSQAKQVAFLGLSLTAIMASALFVLVYVNPKSSEYSYLPLLYSGASLALGFVFNRLSARAASTP